MHNNKKMLCKEIDAMTNELFGISDYLLANPETAYQEFKACEHLTKILEKNGFSVDKGIGDMGNLSHYLPAVHPWIAITEPEIAGHTVEFREATTSERGRLTLINAAKMLAMTAYDFLTSENLREQVKMDFAS